MNWRTLCVSCMQNDSGEPVCPKCGSPFDLPPKNTLQLKPRTMLRDQYLIGRALGHGGFGVTYLAWDIGLESRLALKEYLPSGVAGRGSGETKVLAYSESTQQEFEWGLDRFLEEARTLKKFAAFPGIVSIDTVFRDNGTAYLVMEFLDGWTLEEFIKRRDGRITFETALRIMLPVIDALCAVHAESVLHRDISPDNIHLTRDGKVKLIDFGAARNALSQKSRNLSIILKEGYAPEEQYRASGIQGPWTDVYATAATIYHCVTGVIPQPALDRLAEDKVRRPSEMGINIDPAAEGAIMVALSLKASDRFQSMEDFKEVLSGSKSVTAIIGTARAGSAQAGTGQALDANDLPRSIGLPQSPIPPSAQPLPAPPPPRAPVPPTPATPGRRWLVPGGLGIIAVIAIVVAMTMHRPAPVPPAPVADKNSPVEPSPAVPNPVPDKPADPAPPDPSSPNPVTSPIPNPIPSPSTPANPKPDAGPSPNLPPPANPGRNARGGPGPASPASINPPSGDYDSLMAQAKVAWSQRQYAQVQTLFRQGIKMDPNKPRAYSGLAELQLYIFNDLTGATQNAQAALARGGDAVFHVQHDHSSNTFTVACTGKLYVSQTGVRFTPDTGSHAFSARKAEIREIRKNRPFTIGIRQKPVDLHAFHIRLANGQNYNLAPSSRSSEGERELIFTLLGEG